MPGQLFTNYFLEEGILHTDAWQESLSQPSDFDSFRAQALALLQNASNFHTINEASTEQELIRPLFELLGWVDYLPQQGSDHNEDIPDHLLFGDAESKDRAFAKPSPNRYPDALVVAESKRFNRPLDARGKTSSPHGQILRYLATADINSDGRIRWGILTNGRVWRLYDRRALPRASGYYEVDLETALHADDGFHRLRTFRLLFGRPAFSPQHGAQTSFLEDAIAEGRRYEEQVANDLSGIVFDEVYPALIRALADKSGAELENVRQAALIFLYRLLFLLYAEDRDLLPVNDSRYDDYGLRKSVRDDIDKRMSARDTFSTIASNYYNHITTLCRQVDAGDASIGLPPYNGGLFAQQAAPILDQVQLPDAVLAPIIHNLSRVERRIRPPLCQLPRHDRAAAWLDLRAPARARTRPHPGRPDRRPPQQLRTQGQRQLLHAPTARRSHRRAHAHAAAGGTQNCLPGKSRCSAERHRAKADRIAELRRLDPAEAALNLKVLDPAMGSGHFLVTAVDYLSDAILELVEYAPTVAPWLESAYTSPLVERVAAIRENILARAHAANWVIDEPQLTDQAIIRRMVLKRCIYGVDKNPLTVELAKVSLWLHSFTVGAPLSFLDHHLRCGDSLIGLRVHNATQELSRLGGFTSASAIQAAENATAGMQRIEEMSDADIAQVEESATLFREVEKTTADLRGLLNTFCGVNWLGRRHEKEAACRVRSPAPGGNRLAGGRSLFTADEWPRQRDAADPIRQRTFWPAFTEMWRAAKEVADREGFCTGKSPSPASGTAGRTTSPSAASTPSSATRPGIK